MPEIMFSEYYLFILFLPVLGNHFNTRTMGPLANKEKCRSYRKKHREEYHKSDAFRKKYKIALLKVKDLVKLQR